MIEKKDIAWRGYVTKLGEVVAWPTLLADHAEFQHALNVTDSEFDARWRQWYEGAEPDFDLNTPEEAKKVVRKWLDL